MVSQKYRWDFIGLSTDTKPTSETSDKVVNGSTYYCSDTSKLYVYCDGTWYERKPLGGGGTSDFNDLSNRPKYNGSDMTGSTNIPEVKTYTAGSNVAISDQNVISATDTTYSAFTGTDGTAAGEAGLVPAPVATDAGYFLSASGDWEEIPASGGAKELTSADYDYPADNPNSIAAWALDNGWYTAPGCLVRVNSATSVGFDSGSLFYVKKGSGSGSASRIVVFGYDNTVKVYSTDTGSGSEYSSTTQTVALAGSTGTSTSLVMSQNATTSMVYADPATKYKIHLGVNGSVSGNAATGIGYNIFANGNNAIAIGNNSTANGNGSIALGVGAKATSTGEVNIGADTQYTTFGYNNSNYRLLTGVYDPQSAHDAATKGYVDPTTDSSAPTTATVGRLGQIQIDTTNNDVYMCVAVDNTTPAYTWKKITV